MATSIGRVVFVCVSTTQRLYPAIKFVSVSRRGFVVWLLGTVATQRIDGIVSVTVTENALKLGQYA